MSIEYERSHEPPLKLKFSQDFSQIENARHLELIINDQLSL